MKKSLLSIFTSLLLTVCSAQEKPFDAGEELHYDIHYKYGLITMKAGTATFAINPSEKSADSSVHTSLTFKTTSFFDRIHKMRDTLKSTLNERLEPIYNIRKVNEGNTHYSEEIFFNAFGYDYSEVRVIRKNQAGAIRFDTVHHSSNAGFDLLSILTFARTLDYEKMYSGETLQITNFIGRDRVDAFVRFAGTETLKTREGSKYQSFKLNIDASDSAFKESGNAMEIWIGADKNRLPLKLKAKLKIGAGEAELVSSKNLKYPLESKQSK
jgi:hypothetical protein